MAQGMCVCFFTWYCDTYTDTIISVEKVVFVSGKLYYDLVKERENRGLSDKIALCRIEVMHEICMWFSYNFTELILIIGIMSFPTK